MVLAHKRKERVKVTRIDRLARSIGDLQDIVRQVKARGASLRANEQPIDTGTAVASALWTCSACSRSSKPISARNASLRALARRRPRASTRAGQLRSMPHWARNESGRASGRYKDRQGARNKPGLSLPRIGTGPLMPAIAKRQELEDSVINVLIRR